MNQSISILGLITGASLVVQLVMAVLLLLSILSWVLIFHLGAKLGGASRFDARFEDWFWTDSINKQFATVTKETERTALEAVFYDGYKRAADLPNAEQADIAERELKVALGREQNRLEQGLAPLASIGSVSPYIGLFGTVWGIMNAFIGLGQAQSVSLATVAPSIAEALIATALGLFAAIPASLAYNYFTAKANSIYERRALFCESLISALLTKR